jgi:hypothetical protein
LSIHERSFCDLTWMRSRVRSPLFGAISSPDNRICPI